MPYYNGNAMGYAFGCAYTPSPSLKQMLKSMEVSCGNSKISKDIQLNYLVKQGVFLLNTILTVRAGSPLSHENIGWQSFTKTVISKIQEQDNIVWLLYGSKARVLKSLIKNPTNFVIEDNHPASASYEGEDWNSLSFRDCNNFLKSKNIKEIKWL